MMFLVLGTFNMKRLAASFLIGCLLKAAVTKYGGAKLYQTLKPLMIGLICGDVLAQVVPTIIAPIYFFATNMDKTAPMFSVFQ